MTKKCGVNSAKTVCNTNSRRIIVNFRVSVKEWKLLLRRAGGKGKLSRYIRRKLGIEGDKTHAGESSLLSDMHRM